MDNSLDWKEHIKVDSSMVSKAMGFLKQAKRFLSVASLKTLYLRIVEPPFRIAVLYGAAVALLQSHSCRSS